MSTKRTVTAPVTSLDIIQGLLAGTNDGSGDFQVSLREAERLLPALVQTGFGDCAIEEAAHALLDATDDGLWPDAREKWNAFVEHSDDPMGRIGYLTAGASFALGMVAGMRLGGGAR